MFINSLNMISFQKSIYNSAKMLRYCLLVPLALLVASVVAGWRSYANAREDIADDLNEAMIALANENRNLWTRQDTGGRAPHYARNHTQACDIPGFGCEFQKSQSKRQGLHCHSIGRQVC